MGEAITLHRPLYATDDDAYLVDARLRPPGERTARELSLLQTRHRRMIEMHVQGFKNREIARALGVAEMAVCNCLRSPISIMRIRELNAAREAKAVASIDRISEMSIAALEVVDEMLHGKVTVELTNTAGEKVTQEVPVAPHTRLNAAVTILDRNPFTAKVAPRKEQEDSSPALTAETIAEIKRRFRESQGTVVDVTVEPISGGPVATQEMGSPIEDSILDAGDSMIGESDYGTFRMD